MCDNKRRFADEFSANAVAMESNIALATYHCPHCRGWHVTSSNPHNPDRRPDRYVRRDE